MIFPLNLEKAVFNLMQNLTSKLQFNGFLFPGWWIVTYSPLYLFSTFNVLSVSFNVFSLLISRASRTFLLCMLALWRLFLGEFSLIFHGWFSMQSINTFFFDLSISFYLPLHEQSGTLESSITALVWSLSYLESTK